MSRGGDCVGREVCADSLTEVYALLTSFSVPFILTRHTVLTFWCTTFLVLYLFPFLIQNQITNLTFFIVFSTTWRDHQKK